MTSSKIHTALRAQGLNASIVAEAVGVTRAYVYHVISGYRRSRRVGKALAQFLGVAVEDLFPEALDYYTTPDPNERRAEKVAALRKTLNAAGLDTSRRKHRQQGTEPSRATV